MKRIIAFLFAVLIVTVPFLICVNAEESEAAEELVTVSEEEYEDAVITIKDKYPEEYAVVEKYYSGMVAAVESTGMMQKASDFLYKHTDQLCAIIVSIGVVAVSVFTILTKVIDKISIRDIAKTAKTSNNNAVQACQDAAKKIDDNCNEVKRIADSSEKRMYEVSEFCVNSVNECRNDVNGKLDQNERVLEQVAKSMLVISGILSSIVDEMDVKPTTKNSIHAAINKANEEVKNLEKPVEKTDP